MDRRDELQRAIGRLQTQLDPTSSAIDELAQIRRWLVEGGTRKPVIELPNLRLGFACKQRWDDMVGDDRVRACGGCDRPVFNLSEMTRDEAERVLATRGLTPCVRFYRRPDGTVMTTDCPSGARREGRRLAVLASSLAAGAALAAPSSARAEPAPDPTVETSDAAAPDPATQISPLEPVVIEDEIFMGVPISNDYEMGVLVAEPRERPAVQGSLWGRLGMGFATQHPTLLARSLTPPESTSAATWDAAIAADVTVGLARNGDIRLGAWGEVRTSSGPVVGGELVVQGLPPHPMGSRIGGSGTIVLRAGGNAHVVTTAIGLGYVGMRPRTDPWIRWAGHLVGARIVASVNRSRDDSRDWSATLGLEVELLGAARAVFDVVTDR